MKIELFESLIKARVIDRLTIYSHGVIDGIPDGWELWAYSDDQDGARALLDCGNRLRSDDGSVKRWASLDGLWKFLTETGGALCSVAIEQSPSSMRKGPDGASCPGVAPAVSNQSQSGTSHISSR